MPRTDETAKNGAAAGELAPKKATSDSAKARKQMFGNLLDLFGSNSQSDLTESAIASTSALIEKQPDNPLLYASRASYHKQAKQYEESIKDYTKALELGKSKQLAYMWLEGRAWPNVIVQYFLGKASSEKVINATCSNDDLTEAHWFIGAKHLYDSRPEDAARHFAWVVDNGNKSFIDYELAKKELAALQ